jgi:hypothetical protein
VANATNLTSGTWTNATGMIAVVLAGQNSVPIGGHLESGGSSSTTAVAPSITMSKTDGTSVLLIFLGHAATVSAWSAAPSGYTQSVASTGGSVCLDIKTVTTSDGACTQSLSASSSGYRGNQIEILAAVPIGAIVPGSFNRPPIIRSSLW